MSAHAYTRRRMWYASLHPAFKPYASARARCWFGKATKQMVRTASCCEMQSLRSELVGAVLMQSCWAQGTVTDATSPFTCRFRVHACRVAAMLVVKEGQCGVLVDPHYKDTSDKLGEVDPKHTVQVTLVREEQFSTAQAHAAPLQTFSSFLVACR